MNSQLVKENPTAMGNAWLTKNVKFVANADEEILALNSQQAVSISNVSELYEVLVNGVSIHGETKVSSQDAIAFTIQQPGPDGVLRLDTIDTKVPFEAVAELDLALIPKDGQLTWAYNDLIDSTFNKILIVSGGGREGWNPKEETIISQDFKDNISQDSYSGEGKIYMTSYNPDDMVYSFSSTDKQLAVFSEIYYPIGWKAYIDGGEVPISKVNYLLRAIEIPAGDHKVEFVYKSPANEKSATYAYIGNVLLLLLFAGGIFFSIKNKEGEDEDPVDVEEKKTSDDSDLK